MYLQELPHKMQCTEPACEHTRAGHVCQDLMPRLISPFVAVMLRNHITHTASMKTDVCSCLTDGSSSQHSGASSQWSLKEKVKSFVIDPSRQSSSSSQPVQKKQQENFSLSPPLRPDSSSLFHTSKSDLKKSSSEYLYGKPCILCATENTVFFYSEDKVYTKAYSQVGVGRTHKSIWSN